MTCRADFFVTGTATPAGAAVAQRLRALGSDVLDEDRADGSASLVVHCATQIDPGPSGPQEGTNPTSTARALELARRWEAGFLQLSSVHVFGGARGAFAESAEADEHAAHDPHTAGLAKAERLVTSSGLAWAIVRSGFLFGPVRRRGAAALGGLGAVLSLAATGRVRVLPGSRSATLWLSPIDYLAQVVTQVAVQFSGCAGRAFHATGSTALPLREFAEVLAEYPCLATPDVIAAAVFSEQMLSLAEQDCFRLAVSPYLPYFRAKQRFDTSNARGLGLTPPRAGAAYYRRNIDACLDAGLLVGREESAGL